MDYGTVTYARRGGAVQRFALRMGEIKIGRAPDNDLVLDAETVAPYHATLFCTEEGCWVSDLANSPGTYLNTVRLPAEDRRRLRDGDMLRIGPFFVRYTAPTQSETVGGGAPGTDSRERQAPLPPEVAARLPQRAMSPRAGSGRSLRRLPGNAGPPRIPPGARRMTDGASSYMQYLSPVYHDDEFIGRFLLIFESILDPLERMIDQIHLYFDPRLTPEALLPWLATWVDLVLNENWPDDRRRALIRSAASLYQWRGTRRGMIDYIRLFSGIEPIIVEPGDETPDGIPLPEHIFKVILDVPAGSEIDRELLEAIVESEKPAHTAYILEIRQI